MKLVEADKLYQRQIVEMLNEWSQYNDDHPEANRSPSAIFKDYGDFDMYVRTLNDKSARPGKVPSSTYFLYDENNDIMLGAISIRHYLNDQLLLTGGHIGDGVRPSERRKGYATLMISLGLEVCKQLHIDRVLMVCDKDNIGSARSIINNGGILENEILIDGKIVQRYWIDNH